jgi:hypothetical protein
MSISLFKRILTLVGAIPTNPILDTEDGSSFSAIPAPTDMALESVLEDVKIEVETTSLAAAEGSIADYVRAGEVLRATADAVAALTVPDAAGVVGTILGTPSSDIYTEMAKEATLGDIETEVETTSLTAGFGSMANYARSGEVLRAIADSVGVAGAGLTALVVPDAAGVVGTILGTPSSDIYTEMAKEVTLGAPLKSAAPSDLATIIGDPGASDIATIVAAIPTVTPDAAGVVGTILGTPLTSDIYTEMAKEGADGDTLKTLSDQIDLGATSVQAATILAQTSSTDGSGTFSYLDAGGKQAIVELVLTEHKIIDGIWLDLVNMTQNGTITLEYKIDGSTYRVFDTIAWTTAEDDGKYIDINAGVSHDFKVSWTEAVDEGAARDIPYQMVYRNTEQAPA